MDVFQGARVRGFLTHLEVLGRSAAPPCVFASALRAALNGWVTARRFQGGATCVLGSPAGADSIQHCAACGCYHRWCSDYCALARPSPGAALSCFLGLRSSTSLEGSAAPFTSEEAQALRGVSVYALYKPILRFDTGPLGLQGRPPWGSSGSLAPSASRRLGLLPVCCLSLSPPPLLSSSPSYRPAPHQSGWRR